jgi:hypothetical protein
MHRLSFVIAAGVACFLLLTAVSRVRSREQTLHVISREEWHARPPTHAYKPHVIDRITIHHQAVMAYRYQDAKKRLRIMQYYHQHHPPDRGFADVAYHFIIDRRGRIYEGRSTAFAGETSAGYDPTGHLLICLLGDFRKQHPTRQQQRSLIALVNWAIHTFGVSKTTIRGHRDYVPTTTCPGQYLYELIHSEAFLDALDPTPAEEAASAHDTALHPGSDHGTEDAGDSGTAGAVHSTSDHGIAADGGPD